MRINEMAFAAGNLEKLDGEEFIGALQERASEGGRPKPARAASLEELQSMMGDVAGNRAEPVQQAPEFVPVTTSSLEG